MIWALALFSVAGPMRPILSQESAAFDAEFEISRSPSVAVLQYHRDVGMLAEPDPTPFLRIYGDGRVLVHYPRYMKKAGEWEGRIETARLDALVRWIVERRLLEFDAPAVKGEIEAEEAATKEAAKRTGHPVRLFEVSDEESTRVRVVLQNHKPAGVLGAPGEPVDKEIVWWGLRHDAERYPRIRSLRELAAFEAELLALAEGPDLVRLEREASHE